MWHAHHEVLTAALCAALLVSDWSISRSDQSQARVMTAVLCAALLVSDWSISHSDQSQARVMTAVLCAAFVCLTGYLVP
jgi:hypothetical protein